MKEYSSISLDKRFLESIDEKIKDKGYLSRAEFCREAIRRELERLNKNKGAVHGSQ